MSSSKKLSLISAVFINLNVMIGAGVFINTFDLSKQLGAASFLLYPIIGICMLPLIAITGKLVKMFPTGGIYAFGKSYSPFLGFLSCWSYFFGKLASCSVMLSVGTVMLQQIIPATQQLPAVVICLIILAFFTFFNLQQMKVGVAAQTFFLTCKSIPLIFAIVAGVILWDTSMLQPQIIVNSSLLASIPLALYGLAGFETACALGRNIENPAVNGPKAVYYSFTTILLLYGIFQACVYMNIFNSLATISGFEQIFPTIAHQLFDSSIVAHKFSVLLSLAIGFSALGGAYGILFANSWNLYTLAENNHLFASNSIAQLNQHHTPWIAVVAESLICTIFLLCNQTSLLSLRTSAALGIIIAYTISAFAYYRLIETTQSSLQDRILSIAAFFTCLMFIATCAFDFYKTGLAPLILFVAILIAGIGMFMHTKVKN